MCSRTLGAADTAFRIIRTRSHSHSFALVHAPRLSSASSPERILSLFLNHPVVSRSLTLSLSLLRVSIRPKLSYRFRGSAKSSAQTHFSHPARTSARVCTPLSSNLLIAIEQLSDGKLSYSCSLGPFAYVAPFALLSLRVFLSTRFYLLPLCCGAFTHVSFQASRCTIKRINSITYGCNRSSSINTKSAIISISLNAIRFSKRRLTLIFIQSTSFYFIEPLLKKRKSILDYVKIFVTDKERILIVFFIIVCSLC